MGKLRIVCPHCTSINAVTVEVNKKECFCDACEQSLNDTTPLACSVETFETHLVENDIALLVDFYSPACEPCMKLAPEYEEAAKKFALEVRFLKVNTLESPEIARRYGVNELPTIIAFNKGQEVNRFSRSLPQAQLSMWAESLIQMDHR